MRRISVGSRKKGNEPICFCRDTSEDVFDFCETLLTFLVTNLRIKYLLAVSDMIQRFF